MAETVLIAAGGTGGHVFPGLATAEALRRARPDIDVVFVGTADRLEARLVPEHGWQLHTVPAMALQRDLSLLKLPVVLSQAVRSVRQLIRQRDVIAAVGFGGYTSVPLALAARTTGTPLVVHEQNAVAGRANKLAARGAQAVALSFTQAAPAFGRTQTVLTGNPVRPDLLHDMDADAHVPGDSDAHVPGDSDAHVPGDSDAHVPGDADAADPAAIRKALRAEAQAAFGLDPDRRTLLAFGGSQGALRINTALTDSVGRWADPGRLQVLHAAGARTHDETVAAWDSHGDRGGLAVQVLEFIDRMDLAYAAADIVLCRAGASSIAELTVLGVPSVLVPYPHATDDHQMANARAVEAVGAAKVIPDEELDAAALVSAVEPLLTDTDTNDAMALAAAEFGRPRAADDLADLVLEVALR